MIKITLFVLLLLTLSSGRVIQWTAAGGNPLWSFANNWDSLTVPTINDDVIINLANIPGSVTIADAAFANSLTVGGNSNFAQSVNVQNSLTIGVGGGSIKANGMITVNSAPSLPFCSQGQFNAGSNLLFVSGTLCGNFEFTNVNFSGAAAKQINGTTNVTGILIADLPVGSQGLISIVGGELVVTGTFKVTQTLTISASTGAKLNIPGTLDFAGSVSNTVTVLGNTYIATLSVEGGNFVLNDDVTIGLAKVSQGATVTMIGANTVNRVFSDVSGGGTLNIQGGTNTFHSMSSISTVTLSGGVLVADTKQCNVVSFTQTGGSIGGSATVSAGTATFSNAVINNTPVTAATLILKGFSSINGGSLTVTSLGNVAAASQLTLGGGAVFAVASTAKVTQSYALEILPSGTTQVPSFRNDGKWTSTATLTLDTLTSGVGSFEFQSGSSMTATGISFTTKSLLLTQATFTSVGSTVSIASVDGTGGTIISQSQVFTVSGNLNVATFTHQNGITNVATGNIQTLDVQTGTYNVTGSSITVGSLTFEGGQIQGTSKNAIVASSTSVTSNQPKTIKNIVVSSTAINLACGAQQCQLLTLNAKLTTSPPS
jgi:hypothetical protein